MWTGSGWLWLNLSAQTDDVDVTDAKVYERRGWGADEQFEVNEGRYGRLALRKAYSLFQLVPASKLTLSLGYTFLQRPMQESKRDQKSIWRPR
ncbi:hypothetical protein JAAARDRAFT_61610 [Jaapia argillacea MUCL 33604]|uniref:Uncharacterized protein n=1 Tax=Jaapia argillacea MUCL 33604 TaxID=933084 RepID=A0A067PP37_9AGAM|nr:hypothetical protein JAAARDRAFT_61610 [Jaapia argillacea MUCL 33604]